GDQRRHLLDRAALRDGLRRWRARATARARARKALAPSLLARSTWSSRAHVRRQDVLALRRWSDPTSVRHKSYPRTVDARDRERDRKVLSASMTNRLQVRHRPRNVVTKTQHSPPKLVG